MTQFKIGQTYKTRGGYEAEIYAIKEGQAWPYKGAHLKNGSWDVAEWSMTGESSLDDPFDLLPPTPEKVKVWLFVHKNKNNGTIISTSSTVKNEYKMLNMGKDWTLISGPRLIEMEVGDD